LDRKKNEVPCPLRETGEGNWVGGWGVAVNQTFQGGDGALQQEGKAPKTTYWGGERKKKSQTKNNNSSKNKKKKEGTEGKSKWLIMKKKSGPEKIEHNWTDRVKKEKNEKQGKRKKQKKQNIPKRENGGGQ